MASGPSESEQAPEDEQLGDYLLNTERLYDCFFVVGNTEQSSKVRSTLIKYLLGHIL